MACASCKKKLQALKDAGVSLATTASRSLKLFVNGERVFSYAQLKQKRMSICKSCQHYHVNTKQCGMCHCFLPAKVALAASECPIGKW